jgi:hypothetical protein
MFRTVFRSSVWLILALAGQHAMAENFPIAAAGTEGLHITVAHTGTVVATFQGNSAWNNNTLFLMLDANGKPGADKNLSNDLAIFNNKVTPVGTSVRLGTFQAGTELVFRLQTVAWQDGRSTLEFYSGDASRNPDAVTHARVQTNWRQGTTLVSFEDLYRGPFNYNDMSFSFTNTVAAPVPEAPPAVLMTLGLGAVAPFLRRRRADAKKKKASCLAV